MRFRGVGQRQGLGPHVDQALTNGPQGGLGGRAGLLRMGRQVHAAETVISFQPWDTVPLPEGPWDSPRRHGDRLVLRTSRPTEALFALTSWAMRQERDLRSLTVTRPSPEDVYLQLTDNATARSGDSNAH